jgi:hypothetical protein
MHVDVSFLNSTCDIYDLIYLFQIDLDIDRYRYFFIIITNIYQSVFTYVREYMYTYVYCMCTLYI